MIGLIVLLVFYISGLILSMWMIRVEHEAESGGEYTKGDQVITIIWSLLSWITVVIVLWRSWFETVGKTGYWKQPVKKQGQVMIVKQEEKPE